MRSEITIVSDITFTPREKRVLTFSCTMMVIGLMAVDFFNPLLPSIQDSLHTDQSHMKNVIVIYLIAVGLAQFCYGNLSDSKGRKVALTCGLIIAGLGMIYTYYCSNITQFYIGRIITACGTASCTVNSRAMIVDIIKGPPRLKVAFSYFTMAAQLSPAFAPMVSSALGKFINWRIQFLLFALITFSAMIIVHLRMPETLAPQQRLHPGRKLQSYYEVITNGPFISYSLAAAIILAFTLGYYASAPFAFHAARCSPLVNSAFYALYATTLFIGSFVNSRITATPARTYHFCLCALLILCSIGYTTKILDHSLYIVGIFSALLAFICGVSAPSTMTMSMIRIEKAKGAASAVQGSLRMLTTGLSLMLFTRVEIHNFTSIVAIFIVFTLILIILEIITVARIPQKSSQKQV